MSESPHPCPNALWAAVRSESMEAAECVRSYYQCLDEGSYERLRELLDPEFVQYRGDRTFESREAFLQFMESERPLTETTHEIGAVCASATGQAAYGTLLDRDGDAQFEFIDVFEFGDDGRITRLTTYASSA